MMRRALISLVITLGPVGCERHHAEHEGHDHHSSEHAPHGEHGDGERDGHGEEQGHGDENGHGEAHGHGHGEDTIGITRYSQKLELFAEHPPAVTGRSLPFLAHLTILDGFQALEGGTVTLVLDGPTHVEATAHKNLRPGIFQPELTAPAPGTYQASLVVEGPAVSDTLSDFQIVVHPYPAAAQAAAIEEPDGPEPISLLKEQQWQVSFHTEFAARDTLIPRIEVPGEVTAPPSGQAEIGATVAGRVVAPRGGLPRPGQLVKAGQLLATIAPTPTAPETAARAELAVVEAKARLQAAKIALERAERLLRDRAIPERDVEDARREVEVAEAATRAASRTRSAFTQAASGRGSGSYQLSSPIAGVVTEVHAAEGMSVKGGERLLQVINLDALWVRAKVPEQQAALLRSDQDAAFLLPGLDAWLPLDVTGDDRNATLVNVGRTVDRQSRTVSVIYELAAPDDRLRVGAMVTVAVPAGEPWTGVIVPESAVLEDDGRSVVYVQIEGEAFAERAVRLGPRSGALVGVESGLREGERIVTQGANVVRLTSRAGSAPSHGHVH